MPAIDFPNSPTLNQTYTNGIQTYRWNGTAWRLVRTSAVGPTGPTGPAGLDSTAIGATGIVRTVYRLVRTYRLWWRFRGLQGLSCQKSWLHLIS